MRGFPSWPAQLLDGKFRVEFFGTHDTASVAKLELEPWQGTNFKQLCGKSKAKAFKLAVKEAAAAYNGALPATTANIDRQITTRRSGLWNLNHTCYANSVVPQALCAGRCIARHCSWARH